MTDTLAVPDASGHYGPYGGRFVPEALIAALAGERDEAAAARDRNAEGLAAALPDNHYS